MSSSQNTTAPQGRSLGRELTDEEAATHRARQAAAYGESIFAGPLDRGLTKPENPGTTIAQAAQPVAR